MQRIFGLVQYTRSRFRSGIAGLGAPAPRAREQQKYAKIQSLNALVYPPAGGQLSTKLHTSGLHERAML